MLLSPSQTGCVSVSNVISGKFDQSKGQRSSFMKILSLQSSLSIILDTSTKGFSHQSKPNKPNEKFPDFL